MKIERPLLTIDIESTGPDPCEDAIVQYGFALLRMDGTVIRGSKRFKPWKPMSPEAEEVTGIHNADLADCPPFSEWAERIHGTLKGKDLAGYNLARFDLVILDEEMRRSRLKLDLAGVGVVDLFGIFSKKNPRKLLDAVRLYCGEPASVEFAAGAHDASHDAFWTLNALQGVPGVHPDLEELDLAALATFSKLDDLDYVDLARKLYRNAEGAVCFAFGKNQDKRVIDQPGYCQWMADHQFPGSTMDVIDAELRSVGK